MSAADPHLAALVKLRDDVGSLVGWTLLDPAFKDPAFPASAREKLARIQAWIEAVDSGAAPAQAPGTSVVEPVAWRKWMALEGPYDGGCEGWFIGSDDEVADELAEDPSSWQPLYPGPPPAGAHVDLPALGDALGARVQVTYSGVLTTSDYRNNLPIAREFHLDCNYDVIRVAREVEHP